MEQAEKGQVKSLVKALELLDILSNKQAPMTLRELYQASGYPKSTIYALLSTLRAYGCIRQESDGRYYLGMKLFQWGCSVSASWDITRLARPYLERLARDTGSTALLSRVEGSSITVIDQCVSGAGIRVASEMGSHVSLYATSQGKLLLASLSDSAVRFKTDRIHSLLILAGPALPVDTLVPNIRRCRQFFFFGLSRLYFLPSAIHT